MDHIAQIVERWRQLRPDLDPSPMLIIGRIHRLAAITDGALSPTFARAGLAAGDFDVLAALRRAPGHARTAGELHRALMVTTGAITKRSDRLAAQGLVTRGVGSQDARVRDIVLTAPGVALVDELLAIHLDTERQLLASLSPAQLAVLADALEPLTTALEAVAEPTPVASSHPEAKVRVR
jgi:DNA-binding MarR family transcriptional regulator